MRQLTFTRYVAAMLVVFFHFGGDIASGFPALRTLLRQGPAMVAYFYVLSGFILGTVHGVPLDAAARRRFWVARFARIYPTYLLALVLTIIIFLAFNVPVPLSAALLEATLLQAWVPGQIGLLNYPGWSLSAEAFFYALFPFIAWGLFHIRSTTLVVTVSVAAWVATWVACEVGARLFPQNSGVFDITHYNPLLHTSSFLLGVAGAVVLTRHGKQLLAARWLAAGGAFALWVGVAAAIIVLFLFERRLSAASGLQLPTDRVLAPLYALLILALAIDASRVARALSARPLVALGEASYAVYILQVPVWHLYRFAVGGRIDDPLAFFALFATLLTGVSLMVLYGFERPARAWLRRLGDATAAPPGPLSLLTTFSGKRP